jgi:hypothetical protein
MTTRLPTLHHYPVSKPDEMVWNRHRDSPPSCGPALSTKSTSRIGYEALLGRCRHLSVNAVVPRRTES